MPAKLRIVMVLCLLFTGQAPGPAAQSPASISYDAFAVRFGILPAFAVSGLVAGADRPRRLDIPVMVWLLKGSNGRILLVDSGFYRQKFIDSAKLVAFTRRAPAPPEPAKRRSRRR